MSGASGMRLGGWLNLHNHRADMLYPAARISKWEKMVDKVCWFGSGWHRSGEHKVENRLSRVEYPPDRRLDLQSDFTKHIPQSLSQVRFDRHAVHLSQARIQRLVTQFLVYDAETHVRVINKLS